VRSGSSFREFGSFFSMMAADARNAARSIVFDRAAYEWRLAAASISVPILSSRSRSSATASQVCAMCKSCSRCSPELAVRANARHSSACLRNSAMLRMRTHQRITSWRPSSGNEVRSADGALDRLGHLICMPPGMSWHRLRK
jgi:hypothetical protein